MDIISDMRPFYVWHPVFLSDLLFTLLQPGCCDTASAKCFISFACTHKTFKIYPYAKTGNMPWRVFKMIINISGNICIPCTKTSTQRHTNLKKLFNTENNRWSKIIFHYLSRQMPKAVPRILSYQKRCAEPH